MSTETEQALALVFRRFQETPVPEDELVKTMSLTLNWTKPSSAANLLDRGVEAGLLERGEDGLAPRFDPGEVDVEFGFDPSGDLFEPVEVSTEPAPGPEPDPEPEAEPDDDRDRAPTPEADPSGPVLEPLVQAIADATDDDRNAAIAAVNAKQEQLGGLVTLPAAALIVAHEHGIDTREHADAVLEDLRRSAKV